MNCYYCKEPCQLINTRTDVSWEEWVCRQHSHSVVFHTIEGCTTYCRYHTQYKNRGYVVAWYKGERGESWSLYVATDTTNGIPQSDGRLIQTQFIPERFTPDTIDKKLPLLLPFL
jgi:hypothetical protein